MSEKKKTLGRKVPAPYPAEVKLRVVREVLESGVSATEIAALFGVSAAAVHKWLSRFRRGGVKALTGGRRGPSPRTRAADSRREGVVAVKRQQPAFGTRRIADELRRFEGVGVSEATVRRILHEEGLLQPRPPQVENAPKPETRFERAAPNQLWQSDIFTFLLRRHSGCTSPSSWTTTAASSSATRWRTTRSRRS